MILVLQLAFSLNAAHSFSSDADMNLVLIGIAIEKQSQLPVNDVVVELTEIGSTEKNIFSVEANGHFYFGLKPDRQYQLSLIGQKGKLLNKKQISTINKYQPEVLHAILESSQDKKRYGY